MAPTKNSKAGTVGNPTEAAGLSEKTNGPGIDPRVERTRRAIWEALLSLTLQGGFDAVSVARIARCAGINRSTFYAHFPDKHAVVREELARLLRDLRARNEAPTPAAYARFDPTKPHPNALRWFDHVAAHEDFYRALLVTGELAAFEGEVAALITAFAKQRLREWPGPLRPELPISVLIAASTAQNLGLVRWWLSQEPRPDPEVMAVMQQRVQSEGILPLLGLGVGGADARAG